MLLLTVFLLVSNVLLESNNYFTLASVCSGGNYEVPDFLSATHINVAAASNGATCEAITGSTDCANAIDGSISSEWQKTGGGVGIFVKITFARQFTINTLRIMQRSSTIAQNKKIALEFSGGEIFKTTLKRNTATVYSGPAMWEVKYFPEVRASWVKVTVESVYSSNNNGFREIEIYNRNADKGKLCDTLVLPLGIKSEGRPLFGRTVSLILKSSGVKVFLHSKDEPLAKKYTFGIGVGGKCTLSRFDSTDAEVRNVACANIVTPSGLRSVWIDLRSANIVLGSGTTVLFEYLDASPFEVGYISFEATTETNVTLCNRENKCYQDADHYWPMDKISGGEFQDTNGGKSAETNISHPDMKASFTALNMYANAPMFDTTAATPKDAIFGDFMGDCIGDVETCADGMTLSFRLIIPGSLTTTTRILGTRETGKGFIVHFKEPSNIISGFYLQSEFVKLSFAIAKDKQYHIAMVVTKDKNLKMYANGIEFSNMERLAQVSSDADTLFRIGSTDARQGTFILSDVAVWNRELSAVEINQRLSCTQVGIVDESCSPAVKERSVGSKYNSDQCTSITCCHDGSTCFRRDGVGTQATISTAGSIYTSSSVESQHTPAVNGKITSEDALLVYTAWSPSPMDKNPYLQIDTMQVRAITAVVVQGTGVSDQKNYVTTFAVSTSKSCKVFQHIMDGSSKKVFNGNTDSTGRVTVAMASGLEARCLRIEPIAFIGKIALKVKILGTRKAKAFHGCYKGGQFTAAEHYDSVSLTPEKCITACGVASKTFAALKYGKYCFCGTSVATAVADSFCNTPCSGNMKLTCGSDDAFSVYSVSGSFPTSFSCTTPAKVASLTPFSTTCTANSMAECDFGESLPVTGTNTALNHSYYSVPSDFNVFCKGYLDTAGESDEKRYDTAIKVYDDFEAELDCPDFAQTHTTLTCAVKVAKGTELQLSYQLPGQSPVSLELCDSIGIGLGETFDTPVGGSQEISGTIVLLDTRSPDDGQFLGIEVNVERDGCVSVQKLRPVCGSGDTNVYTYTDGRREAQINTCSFTTNCTDGQTFSTDSRHCVVNGSYSDNVTLTAPPDRHEVVSANFICFTSVGRHRLHFEKGNISSVVMGDVFALYFPSSGAAKLSSRDSSDSGLGGRSSAVIYTGQNNGIGSVLDLTGSAVKHLGYSILFLIKAKCVFQLPLTYTTIGEYIQKVTVKSAQRSQEYAQTIAVQEKIFQVTYIFRKGAVVNEPYNFTVNAHNGTSISYEMRFDNASLLQGNKTAALEAYSFFNTYSTKGTRSISINLSNGVSQVYMVCQIKVLNKVDGLNLTSSIPPQVYPTVTTICFKVTKGDEVTVAADFGNGVSVANGTFNIEDVFIGCFNHSYAVGVYYMTVNATNDASEQMITQLVIVEEEILELSFVVEHAARDIEVNETICVVTNVTQGTTPTYRVEWGDGQAAESQDTRFCRHYSIYDIYTINVTAFNNVSKLNTSQEIQVHKPVYKLVNFALVCPPTNFSNPTPCLLTIDGGTDFVCDWTFGDGLTGSSNSSHVGKPFNHLYAAPGYYDVNINCTNRLYNITNQTLAIVEKPMIGLAIDQLANCPHGQSTTAYVGVVQGTGVEFTLKKRNFHTGTSVDMVPSFNPEMTNGSVTFACDAIGVYCMDATSVNNVTLQQSFTMCFKVDYAITGATATRLTPEYILVKNTSQIEIKMTQGSNVTCYFDFKDGVYEPPHFTLDVFPSVGKIVSHTYAVEGDFYVNIVCNNSVSEVTFINIIKSQHPAKEVFLVCLERQPFPPGYTQCTIDKPAHIATPTNLTCITSFGDGSQTTNLLVPPLVLTHTYAAIGAYPVDVACSNQMSSVNLTSTVEVQTPIDNDVMLLTTSGGLYGTGSPGRGVDSSYFPTKNNISLDVNWGNGTNVSVSIDWGDGTNTLSTNDSFRHMYTTAGTYTAKITMFNAVSYKTKTFVLHLQDAVEGFTFNNNGPVRMGQEFIFLLAADQVGTEACYSLNVGNGTTYVYKPSVNAICEPECSSGTIYRTYTKSEIPMNITHLHYYIGNYDIYAVGCNKVSRIIFTNLANLSPKPCKYPVVNFTSTEANFTMETAVPYPKASRIILTPLIKIDCQATKLSVRKWDLLKCNDTTGNCSEYSSNCTRDMSTSDPILVIPERCLEYGTYMVKCKVEMIGGGTVGIFTESIAYIKVIKSPLFAKILGGTAKSVGYGKPVPTDGTPSFDPDTGDNVGMNYFWFCGEKTEALKVFGNSTDLPAKPLTLHPDLQAALGPTGGAPSHLYRGCNGHGPGRFDINDTKIIVPTSGMRINHTYVVTVLVAKDTRWATMSLSMVVLEGNPPDCKIVCVAGCGRKINPSDKHSLKVEAICPECGELTYHWYINVRNKTTNQMVPVSNAQEMLKTEINFINIVVKPNMMQGDSEYEFRIEAYDTLHKIKGFAARTGITNSGPKHGSCDVQPKTGDNETPFNVSCSGWHDDDDYLTFSVNLYDENTNILTPLTLMRSEENDMAALVKEIMKLPVGKKDKDFVQKIRIQICDPLLSCETQDVNVTVKLQEQSEGKFQEFLNGVLDPDGTINVLLGEGKIDDLCTYLLNTITTIKSLQATPALASLSEATQNLVQRVVEYSMNSTCQIVSSDSKKASCKSSVISSLLEVKTTITDAVKKQSSDCLMEAASDISSFPPSELANAATGLVSAFGSAIDSGASTTLTTPTIETTPEPQYDEYGTPIEQTPSPSKSSAEQEREKQEQKEQSMKLANTLNNIGGVLLQGMVPGEDLDIATPLLNISVSVKPANELKTVSSPSGTTIGGLGDAMPSNTSEAVSVKLFSFNNNPYGWADGASDVSGALISFKLGNDDGSDKLVKDTPKAFELSIKQTGQTINMTAHQLNPKECNYHLLEVPKNHSSIFVETIPSDPNVTIMLYLRRGDRPTKLLHDFNYTLSPNDTQVNATEKDKSRFMMFMSNDELNNTAAGTWKLAVCEEGGYNSPEEGDGASISYNISMFTAACMFLNETTGKFSDAGLKVGPATTRFVTQCFTTHATSFAGDFFVPPNKIDWSKISLDELLNNPIVFIVVMVIFGMYFILLIWARRADKKDLDKVGLTPLPDNDPRDNYLYEIVIYTGHAKDAGTTSEVYMILTGGLDETSPRQLKDPEPTRVKFLRGAVDYFLLAVPHSLGKLKQLRIWHNNTGSNPSWFLSRVMVRDLQTDTKTWFVNLRWLAVEEDDGQIDRTLQTATKEELTSFNLLFSTEARKNLTDNHLWFSVVARPPKSTFTRVQRLSCCLSVILTTMLANAMFYQTGDESSSGTSIHVGPFSFSIKQISIGITSSLVVLPVNIIVVTIFRKLRPPDPTKKKEDKEKDLHQQGDKYKPDDEVQIITEDASDIDEDDDDNDVEEANDKSKDKKAKAEKTKKKPKKLDPKFAYLAYFLIFIASTVSGTFTVFYGLTFGKEKSEGWISSMMISFWQDVLISQPLKVFAAAMFFALVIKDPNKNAEEETEQQGSELTQDEELVHKNVKNSDDEKALRKLGFVDKPPDPEKLEAARQLRLKQKQMKSIIQEMVQYLFFLVIMLIIAYGNRDPMAYGVTRTMQTFFVDSAYTGMDEFSSSDSPDKYWVWVDKTYLATLKPQYWYGPVVRFNNSVIEAEEIQKQRKIIKLRNTRTTSKWRTVTGNYIDNPSVVHQYKENFVADHETAYLVGSPRIRQLRIKRDQCTMLPFARRMFNECNADYDWDKEDQESYLPSWKPFGVNDTKNPKSKSPWYYRSAWELKGTPYWGQFASYWAGGYVADFGSDRTRAEKMANLLSSQGWIDKYTRAVFAEFTVYNAYTNFFSAVTLLTEVRATGAYHHMPKVQTLRLYRYIGPEMAFIMACEITYIAFLLYFLYNQVKKYRNERQEYFKDAWNYLEIVVLAFSISSVGLYFARMGMTSYTLQTMKESPDTFVSFQYVAFLDEWVSACCSLAVFFSFLKFLRLLRFNRRMALLTRTLKQAAGPLFYFFIYFGVIFLAYAQFGFAVFGCADDNYSSLHQTIVTLFGMTLGDIDFPSLLQANRLFGPLYFFSYVLVIIFILVNVFLSIICDTFNEVNRDVLNQANDHEILSFMMHTVKQNIGKQVGPAIKPTYVEEKSKLEKDVDSIEEISDNIQYAFRNMCMEDIRQMKWFDTKNLTRKKKLLLAMLLEADENYCENDICDAIPIFDEYIANHNEEDIIQAVFAYREKRRKEEMQDVVSRMSDSSEEPSEYDTDSDAEDDYEKDSMPAPQFLSPHTVYDAHQASGNGQSQINVHGTHKSRRKSLGDALNTGKRLRRSSRGDLDVVSVGIGRRSPSCTDLYPDSTS